MVRRNVVLTTLLVTFLLLPEVALGAPGYTISGFFSHQSYVPRDTFRFALGIRTGLPLENADVSFVVYSNRSPRKPLFAKYLVSSIPPGTSRLSFSGPLGQLGIKDGIYPVTVRVEAANRIAQIRTKLIVVDPARHGNLLVALVWNVNETPSISPKGVYLNEERAQMVQDGTKPGWLRTQFLELARHPRVKVSVNLTPQTLHEVLSVARGYKLVRERKIVPVRSESTQCVDARSFLQQTMTLMSSGRLELLPAPYAYPSVAELASRGWRSDVRQQLQYGQDVIERGLKTTSTSGVFLPEYALVSPAIAALRRAGVEYTILSDGRGMERFGVTRVGTGTPDPMLAVANNGGASRLLESKGDPKKVVERLLDYLARLRLQRGKRPTIVTIVVTDNTASHPSGSLLKELYSKLQTARWLRAVTIGEAVQGATPRGRVAVPAKRMSPSLKPYFQSVAKARRSLAVYASMARPENPILARLNRNVLLAESAAWASRRGLAAGHRFSDDVTRTVALEMAKVSTPASQTITLPGQSGKVALNVTNGSREQLLVLLEAKGSSVEFPEGTRQTLQLKPGDNYVTVPVTVLTGGTAPIRIRLSAAGATLAESVVYARTTYFNRMALLVGIIAALLGLLVVVYRKAGAARRRYE